VTHAEYATFCYMLIPAAVLLGIALAARSAGLGKKK
jgi:hypothetical protein